MRCPIPQVRPDAKLRVAEPYGRMGNSRANSNRPRTGLGRSAAASTPAMNCFGQRASVSSADAHAFAGFAVFVLFLDPRVGFRQALVQGCGRLPVENFLDEGVVGVAAGHALRRVQVVFAVHLHAGDLFDLGQQFVDGNQFAGAEVDRRGDQVVAVHDLVNALHAVVNIHEAAGLLAVAPDRDVLLAGVHRLDDLAAERGGRFFAAAVPGAVRAIDVVETGNGRLHAAFVPVFLAEHFGNQLFPAVAALGHRRIRVGFLQRADVRVLLQQRVVGAGGAGEKIAARAGPVGGLDHVGVDENGAQAFHAETLDETHAAHVGGQVIDFHRAFADALAVVLVAHVQAEVLHAGNVQIPFVKRLLVHRADVGEALFLEIQGQVAGDESARAGDDDQIILLQRRVFFHDSFRSIV